MQDLPAKTATTPPSHATPTLPIEDNDQEVWFRYYAVDQTDHATVNIRYSASNRLTLHLEGDLNRLRMRKMVSGISTDIAQRDNYPTEVATWYNVYIPAAGSYIGVWRGKEGEALEFVFEAYDAPSIDNDSFSFATEEDGTYRFDDLKIKFHNNLGDFLHLQSDSPAIDAGDPTFPNEFYRDFDDSLAPIDIVGLRNELNQPPPPAEEIELKVPRDMGADEYPTNSGFSYWWRNF